MKTILFALASLVAACTANATDDPSATESASLDAHPAPAVIARFDATKGELPEGLAVRHGSAYVSFAPIATIARVDANGEVTKYGEVPSTAGGTKGYTLGLAFDGDGALYVAQASFDPSVVPGIFRIPEGGGTATTPWASHPSMTFPNGLAFDASGALWISDSGGAIFRADRAGTTTEWKRDALLAYDGAACANAPPFHVGANGLVVTESDAWLTNTSTGALVRIPIAKDGTAGAATAVVKDCALAGADGLARERDGAFVVALNAQNRLARVDARGTFTTIAQGTSLDFPASVAADEHAVWVTNAAFLSEDKQPSLLLYRRP